MGGSPVCCLGWMRRGEAEMVWDVTALAAKSKTVKRFVEMTFVLMG
jgi:hypothetical protein